MMNTFQTEVWGKSKVKIYDRTSGTNRHTKGHTYVYTPGSLWSHLKYGLGTLAVIVIPPLIPGTTVQGLIMGYMGALVAVLTVVCVWGIVRSLYSSGGRR